MFIRLLDFDYGDIMIRYVAGMWKLFSFIMYLCVYVYFYEGFKLLLLLFEKYLYVVDIIYLDLEFDDFGVSDIFAFYRENVKGVRY
jgi:hypothetical protein